jgi:hypothetical protein
MKKVRDSDIIVTGIKGLIKTLHDLEDNVSRLENQISKMSTVSIQNASPVIKSFLPVLEQPEFTAASHRTEGRKSNIIPFSGPGIGGGCRHESCHDSCYESETPHTKQYLAALSYPAAPGNSLPSGISDFRPALQRDGLILLAWDKRFTETGERYTAYWVTSAGIPRFYASKPLLLADFQFANPDHKSYAAEDGIEFYGQKAPAYIVHVAPDLMMSNPGHGELRTAHINVLKNLGSKVNFNYKYLLKTEKKRRSENPSGNQAC